MSQVHSMYTWYDVMKMAFYLCGLPTIHNLIHFIRKTSDKFQNTLQNLQNTWPVLLKTLKVIKNKESLKNCPSQENPRDTTSKCRVASNVENWNRQGTTGKN